MRRLARRLLVWWENYKAGWRSAIDKVRTAWREESPKWRRDYVENEDEDE